MGISRSIGVSFALACMLAQPSFADDDSAKRFTLRADSTPCAFYLTGKDTTTGVQVTDGLDVDQLSEWLATHPVIDDKDATLYAVGTSVRWGERRAFLRETEARLRAAGYGDLSLKNIRRLAEFLADQRGVFVRHADGSTEKLSELDPLQIPEGKFTDDDEFVVVGAPLFGNLDTKIAHRLAYATRPDISVETISKLQAYRNKIVDNPVGALEHMLQRFRLNFLLPEDFQMPTKGELSNMGQKLVIPAILTFGVFLGQNAPLQVSIPVTSVNALNSAATGTLRRFMGNWFRRSKSVFPSSVFKSLQLNVLFTADLYLSGVGSWHNLGAALTIAGIANFFSTKWLTILFQNLWRTPLSVAIYEYERLRDLQKLTPEENTLTRSAAAALEKYVSLIVTQFFIYSSTTKSSLFNLVADNAHWVRPTAETLDAVKANASEHLLMSFNYGHVMMLVTGVAATVGVLRPAVTGWAAAKARLADLWLMQKLRAVKGWFSGPPAAAP